MSGGRDNELDFSDHIALILESTVLLCLVVGLDQLFCLRATSVLGVVCWVFPDNTLERAQDS